MMISSKKLSSELSNRLFNIKSRHSMFKSSKIMTNLTKIKLMSRLFRLAMARNKNRRRNK